MIYIYHDASGRILQSGNIEFANPDGYPMLTIEQDLPLVGNTHYVQDGELVAKGTAPTEFHTFDYSTKQWIDPRTAETQWAVVRIERNKLLTACDWTQLPDVSGSTQAAWSSYRQALRDLTTQADPFNLTWPVAPT